MNSENTVGHDKKRQKRKKKNNRFMRNAKGFAKQGIYGRGTCIDDDEYNYFINILDTMKNGFEDIEDKVNMANNVFEATIDKEIYLASNQIVCKALESLVGFVSAQNFERFCTKFAENFRPICSDRFASHVLQKMVEIAFLRAMGKDKLKTNSGDELEVSATKRAKVDCLSEEYYNVELNEFKAEHKENCANFVERVSKFLLNNLEDFVWDSTANHIMRTCILCLSGVHVAKIAFEKGGADIAKKRKLYTVPLHWVEVMKEFPNRLEMWPQFSEFPYQEHSSALLGVICIALRVADKSRLKHFGKKILVEAFLKDDTENGEKDKKNIVILGDGEKQKGQKEVIVKNLSTKQQSKSQELKLPTVFKYQCAVILLETILSVAGPKLLTQLYAMLFAGHISQLACKQLTNFSVQKLLHHIKEKEDFENIFTELVDTTEELLKIGNTGVVEALTAGCLRLNLKQAQMIVALQTALHVAGNKEKSKHLFECLIKLKPYDIILKEDKSTFVHLHGSLIVQHILNFNKPIFLVNCITENVPDQLTEILNTPNGSHILDAFMESRYIGEKSREKLIRHLEGFYVDLAVTRCGSRVVEKIFSISNDVHKMRIAKELADKSNMLKGTSFGRIVCQNLRIDTYRLSTAQWKTSLQQNKQCKAAQLFQDIIN